MRKAISGRTYKNELTYYSQSVNPGSKSQNCSVLVVYTGISHNGSAFTGTGTPGLYRTLWNASGTRSALSPGVTFDNEVDVWEAWNAGDSRWWASIESIILADIFSELHLESGFPTSGQTFNLGLITRNRVWQPPATKRWMGIKFAGTTTATGGGPPAQTGKFFQLFK